ncbi:dermonecrotic toxin domain-containing protein [Pseudomonas sp. RA_35y_Pfl2_P32]|uniref:dermonecrotic toxin domain-containing protein n=1 Tax=Pseudomonas sp. RA_35y_Pfl2_P32 TaxID=3088705 RepID=UPI0030D8597A
MKRLSLKDQSVPGTSDVEGEDSIHFDFIKNAVPDWIANSTLQRMADLGNAPKVIFEWHKAASHTEHVAAKGATQASWQDQSKVDRMFASLQDVESFAQPLLTQALLDQYGVVVDVRETFLHLYSTATTSPWVMNVTGGVHSRTVSLLNASLHNFASSETFEADSGFISRPDHYGRYEVKELGITVEQFKALCRTLDIGAQYEKHLGSFLLPEDPMARARVRQRIVDSQKSALKAAAHLALMKKDIGPEAYLTVLNMVLGKKRLTFDGGPLRYYHLSMLDTRFTGIVLIAADLDTPGANVRRVIAYVPHDPEHPLKEYASTDEFARELTRQLRDRGQPTTASRISYQAFFSRFVEHGQRGHFFASLNAKLVEITYHGTQSGSNLPAWRETPVENPNLRFESVSFESDIAGRYHGDLWIYLYEQQLNKILADGRALAISTADADSTARWAWVENLEKMLSDIMQVALLIATPFVPVLGEAMLGYMVYQLVDGVVEGVVELAEGQYLEAAEHLVGVAENLIQFGAFGVGGAIATELVKPALSSFLEGTHQITLKNGEQRLWGQNLQPYMQQNLRLAADSQPDVYGLHQHQGKQILPLGDAHFELKGAQSGQYRLQHPNRPEAYQPLVQSNGSGAFVIEGERPHTWDADALFKRLGPSVEGLSDRSADIRTVSRTDLGALVRMYAENERALPLLSDTVTRFRIERDIHAFIHQMGSSRVQDYLQADGLWQFQLLDGMWPGRAIELKGTDGKVLYALGSGAEPVSIQVEQLANTDLIDTLLSYLDGAETRQLLGDEAHARLGNRRMNAKRVRLQLAQRAEQRKSLLFDSRYRGIERGASAEARVIQEQMPGLPAVVAQELVAQARPEELQALKLRRLPERLENLAKWALRDVRISRAYESFYLESVDNPDFDALALHSLENLPGWNVDVRIELRQYSVDGQMLDSIGRNDAAIRRTLVLSDNGDVQAHDEHGETLHSASDFFTSILQALPDAERTALQIQIGQGPVLKAALRDHALKPYRLLSVLADLPVLKKTTFDPAVMRLRGGAPTLTGELAQLRIIEQDCPEFVNGAFHPSVPSIQRYNYLRGLKLMYENLSLDCWDALWGGLAKANVEGFEANQRIVKSIEVLPDLKKLMSPEQFDALLDRVFTEDGFVPLTESERNLGARARDLEQTGRLDEYQALQKTVGEDATPPSEPWVGLRQYAGELGSDVSGPELTTEVTPQVMANLRQAQRAIYRAKELLPLSGNQLPSIWENGGSAIAKIKGLRGLDLQEGQFTARMTIAEHARKSIDIKGGNCSENSKVTFALLASQPRTARIHLVKATAFDHQYVVIGDDLSNLQQLVVADSWPEFPAAHTADNGYFEFELPALETLEPGPASADFAFVNDAPVGRAVLPEVSRDNTIRQIKINKLHTSGAYAQFTSVKTLGTQYTLPGEVGVSFEGLPKSVIDKRLSAWRDYEQTFQNLLEQQSTQTKPVE